MQVLTTQCPFCKHEVDTTIDHLDAPVVCPSCNKPFEMEMPTAVVTSVHQVDERTANQDRMAVKPEERNLVKVHPVVFRARPIGTLVLALVAFSAIAVLVMSVINVTIAGYSVGETMTLGPASLLTWICAVTLLLVAACAGYWTLLSQFTTLTVTDFRTIYQKGIISRETSEVQNDDVRNIQLEQTFMQRLLGVGGVGISSSGQDDLEIVAENLPHPERIIGHIRENQA